jgi:hypothetical protein
VQHGGDFIGFHAQVNWFPDQDVVVTTFSNDGTQNAKTLNDRAVDLVLADAIAPDKADSKTEIALTEKELDEYVGRYDIGAQIIEIKRSGAQLRAQVTGQPELDVFASEKDKFFWKVVDARLEFQRDEAGAVTALTIFQGGATIKCPRSKPFNLPTEVLDAMVGHYYSTELDIVVSIKREGDKLTATSGTILDAFPITGVSDKKFAAGPLSIDVELEGTAVKAISVNMPRATKMRFARMAS